MKLDGEIVLYQAQKLDSKNIDCNDDALESVAHDSINGTMMENNGVMCNLKSRKRDADQLKFPAVEDFCTAREHDCSMVMDDTDHTNAEEVMDSELPSPCAHASSKTGPCNTCSVLFLDKTILEPELPELIICHKEETCSVVKDICIDEGVPSEDKFLFDTIIECKNANPFLPLENGVGSEMMNKGAVANTLKPPAETERLDVHLLTSHVSTPYDAKDIKNDVGVEGESVYVVPAKESKDGPINKIATDESKEIFSLGELLSLTEFGLKLSAQRSSSDSREEVEQCSSQNAGTSSLGMDTAHEEPENAGEGTNMTRSILVSGAERQNGIDEPILENSLAPDSESGKPDPGSGEVMLVNGDASSTARQSDNYDEGELMATPRISTREESENGSKGDNSLGNALCLLSEECTSAVADFKTGMSSVNSGPATRAVSDKEEVSQTVESKLESQNSTINDANNGSISRQFHSYGPGESSFSAAAPPVTGLISYSGPIAYSGSLSLRSESSTTSTHSFAFPVLQSEWNSSPVRMAKANRRRKRWRHTLLCCKF